MLLGLGEIMMRLATEGRLRFRQALPGKLDASWGGGEANVCVSLAMLGRPSRFVTALPRHAIAEHLAASCLKHFILCDFNYATEDELVSPMRGTGTGRIKR